jgi:hypothetical protein
VIVVVPVNHHGTYAIALVWLQCSVTNGCRFNCVVFRQMLHVLRDEELGYTENMSALEGETVCKTECSGNEFEVGLKLIITLMD